MEKFRSKQEHQCSTRMIPALEQIRWSSQGSVCAKKTRNKLNQGLGKATNFSYPGTCLYNAFMGHDWTACSS